jgi:hypothetical protein
MFYIVGLLRVKYTVGFILDAKRYTLLCSREWECYTTSVMELRDLSSNRDRLSACGKAWGGSTSREEFLASGRLGALPQ